MGICLHKREGTCGSHIRHMIGFHCEGACRIVLISEADAQPVHEADAIWHLLRIRAVNRESTTHHGRGSIEEEGRDIR